MHGKGKKRMLAVDLFAGCGGLTQGLKLAGFEVVAAVEIDELASETYGLNHSEVHLIKSDILKVSPRAIMKKIGLKTGELSLLAGCPPCQGFSSIRTKNGKYCDQDPRNELVHEIFRFAKVFKPKAIMMENVPGLEGRDEFSLLKSRLRALGYIVKSKVLDAAHYGVPQRRRRLILLAGHGFEPAFPEEQPNKLTVKDAFSMLPAKEDDPLQNYCEVRSERISNMIKKVPKNGGSRSELPNDMWLNCHQNYGGFKDVYGRMAWDKPSNTITCGCINPSKGRFLHPVEDRAINLREASLLQSFPPQYKFSLRNGRYAVAAMIGNALPPQFITSQALCLKAQVVSK